MPLISVIVPVYKVERYIHRCVDSILNQTFTDFELILVDDGSPDNCGAICDEYAAKDNRIIVIHKENGGLSDARNAGIDWAFANSDSEWITFIDSDDWVHQKYLESLIQVVIHNNVNISICAFLRTSSEQIDNYCSLDNGVEILEVERFFCMHPDSITAWAKLYKKSLFERERFPKGKIHEDEFVTYKLLFSEQRVAFVCNVLYFYFENCNSITGIQWSKKNLSLIEAREMQLDFYYSHGYSDAYALIAKKYLLYLAEVLTKHIPFLPESKSDKQRIEKYVRRVLRKALKKYKSVYPHNCRDWIFLAAYPKFERVLAFFDLFLIR